MKQTVLILGASGRFGRHAAQAFSHAGWQVSRFDRARDSLKAAVNGVDVVVNGWHPADYSKWENDLLAMHHAVLEALKGSDTTVILPGNVYVYGDQAGEPWGPDTPHHAANRLGQLRIDVETAYRASGVQTILLRGGDFLDTEASGSWFDKVMVAGLAQGRFTYPGDPDVSHAWAYLPDFARAAVALAGKRADLPVFSDIPFPGFTLTAGQIVGVLSEITGAPVACRRMAWWPLRLLAPVWPMARGLLLMRYLWDTPHSLEPDLFAALLPEFQTTDPADAFGRAVAHLELPQAHSLRNQLAFLD